MEDRQWHESRSFFDSVRFAWQGVLYVARSERNMQRQLAVGIAIFLAVIAASLMLDVPAAHIALLVLVSALVLVLEMMNTALELIEDIIHPQYHEMVRRSKDVAAGAVLVASFAAAIVGILILGPPALQVLGA